MTGESGEEEQVPKPCGSYHPLPCGLDKECEVPVAYFNADLESDEVWEIYSADKHGGTDDDPNDTTPQG